MISPEHRAYSLTLKHFRRKYKAKLTDNIGEFLIQIGQAIKDKQMGNSLSMVWWYFKQRLHEQDF